MSDTETPEMAIRRLFNSLPTQRDADKAELLRTFLKDTAHFSPEIVVEACDRFRTGKVGRKTRAPYPPEFVAECEDRAKLAALMARQVERQQSEEKPFEQSPEEAARMKLKMPLWHAAFGSESRLDRLAAAQERGLPAYIDLANEWGIPVPDEVLRQVRS